MKPAVHLHWQPDNLGDSPVASELLHGWNSEKTLQRIWSSWWGENMLRLIMPKAHKIILKATIVIPKAEDTGHLLSHLFLCYGKKMGQWRNYRNLHLKESGGRSFQQVWWWQTNLWWDTRSGSHKCDLAQLSSPGTDPQASVRAHGQETSARRLHFDICCHFLQRLLPSKCKKKKL